MVSTSKGQFPKGAWRARIALVTLLGGAALAGCVSALPEPTRSDAAWAERQWPGVAEQELEHGRKLYVGKCAGCHNLIAPARHSPARWAMEVEEMAERAGVSLPEREAMLRYLVTMSRDG